MILITKMKERIMPNKGTTKILIAPSEETMTHILLGNIKMIIDEKSTTETSSERTTNERTIATFAKMVVVLCMSASLYGSSTTMISISTLTICSVGMAQ